jgi:type IV secretory pathway VirJ component
MTRWMDMGGSAWIRARIPLTSLAAAGSLAFAACGRAPGASQVAQAGHQADSIPVHTANVRGVPLFTVQADDSGEWMALFITGDGGWGDAARHLAGDLAAHGISVVAIDARKYLEHKRTPEQVSRDVATALGRYVRAWGRDRVLLVGYSRGADVMPFVANRLPDELRERVGLIALLSVAQWAGFEFHWKDLFVDTRRPTDRPVLPELERLRGTPVLCVYAGDEHDSLCRRIDQTLAQPYERGGGHRMDTDDADEVARVIITALPN